MAKIGFLLVNSKYIHTKPIHASQKANFLDSGELLVSIKVIPNYELEMLLLAFGEKVQVIKPQSLREQIKNRLEKGFKCYINGEE